MEQEISPVGLPNNLPVSESAPVNPSLSETRPKQNTNHKNIVFGLLLLIAGLLVILFYLLYQNQQLRSQLGLSTFKLPGSTQSCEYDGRVYQVGEGFTASDGCNSCSCTETGEIACTAMACVDNVETSPTISPTDGWEIYTDTAHGFSFKYPDDWQVRNALSANSSMPTFKDDVVFLGIAPKTIQEDYLASIRVIDADLQGIIDQARFIPQGTPLRITSDKETTFLGIPAREMIKINSSVGESSKTIIFEKNNLVYEISGWDEVNNSILSQILSTFEFVGQNTTSPIIGILTPTQSPQ